MIRRLTVLLSLLMLGCAHRPRVSRVEAEANFLGRYAHGMSQACQERFELKRSRSRIIITTSRGLQETFATITTCQQALTFKLDCHMPYKGQGWYCDDHFLPVPEGLDEPLDLTSELALILNLLETEGCGGEEKRSNDGPLVLTRTTHSLVESNPSVLRSQWSAQVCGHQWTVETRCVHNGVRQIGQCTVSALQAQ